MFVLSSLPADDMALLRFFFLPLLRDMQGADCSTCCTTATRSTTCESAWTRPTIQCASASSAAARKNKACWATQVPERNIQSRSLFPTSWLFSPCHVFQCSRGLSDPQCFQLFCITISEGEPPREKLKPSWVILKCSQGPKYELPSFLKWDAY